MSRIYQQTRFRPPPDLRERLVNLAERNRRSLNSEIVFGLEFYARSIEQTEKAPGSRQANPDASQN